MSHRGVVSSGEPAAESAERIAAGILVLRGFPVMLSTHLAKLYGVEPRVLVQAVKRNLARFPADFMFELTREERADLKSHRATSSWGGALRGTHFAFTEQGVAMLSSVLRSDRAVQVDIELIRAFVRLRRVLVSHADLARKLAEAETKHEAQYPAVFEAIRQLMDTPAPAKRRIGFETEETD
jgi:hypothetical protein